jgi:hypothetical protein
MNALLAALNVMLHPGASDRLRFQAAFDLLTAIDQTLASVGITPVACAEADLAVRERRARVTLAHIKRVIRRLEGQRQAALLRLRCMKCDDSTAHVARTGAYPLTATVICACVACGTEQATSVEEVCHAIERHHGPRR